jgi:hypothetical protein
LELRRERYVALFDEIKLLAHTGDLQTALDNWVANIELGVFGDNRAEGDDPGEEFDGSFRRGDPRTEQLQEPSCWS